MTDAAERLRRRYPKSRVPRPMMVGLISVGVVIGLTWLVWTALLHSRPLAAGHIAVVSDHLRQLGVGDHRRRTARSRRFPVTCRVLAQASDFQPVGEQQVPLSLPPTGSSR